MDNFMGYNVFTMNDMIKHGRKVRSDGIFGDVTNMHLASATFNTNMMSTTVGIEDAVMAFAPAVRISELQPFICPCCGGNKYKRMGNKVVCEFCDTCFE